MAMSVTGLTVATWNINSVRLRIGQVERFLHELEPDVLCLQETKCPDDQFPRRAFESLGYSHIATNGQRGYHGVATVSRLPFEAVERRGFCDKGDARHVATTLAAVEGGCALRIHNFYVPSGGDVPDPLVNDKFEHKLAFFGEMADWFRNGGHGTVPCQILVGDLNVAPLETDVWSHRRLLNIVSHTPIEVESFSTAQASGAWVDVVREQVPAEQKLFTWWSYRARDWRTANRGRRLDHIWASPALGGCATEIRVYDAARDWDRPSDHVPVVARFDLRNRRPPLP